MGVQGIAHRIRAPRLHQIEMSDLMDRMHARIRASGAGEADGFAGEARHGVFQGRLHGRVFGLPLPAAERCAVILDDEFVAGHVRPFPRRVRQLGAGDDPPSHGASQQCARASRERRSERKPRPAQEFLAARRSTLAGPAQFEEAHCTDPAGNGTG